MAINDTFVDPLDDLMAKAEAAENPDAPQAVNTAPVVAEDVPDEEDEYVIIVPHIVVFIDNENSVLTACMIVIAALRHTERTYVAIVITLRQNHIFS